MSVARNDKHCQAGLKQIEMLLQNLENKHSLVLKPPF